VDVGEVMRFGWEIWKDNVWLLAGVALAVIGINIVFSVMQEVVQFAAREADAELVGVLLAFLVAVASWLVQIFLGIGQARILLKLCRRQPAEFADLMSGGPWFLPVLGASILFALAMFAGLLLCIIPGIFLAIYLWPFHYLIVDQKTTALGSFEVAYEVGKQNAATTILLWFVSLGIGILGALACGVGIIFAAGLISCLWCTAYLMMAGQFEERTYVQWQGA
jgi:uncharacterized membrane protein